MKYRKSINAGGKTKMPEGNIYEKIANTVRGLLNTKDKLEHIDRIERNVTNDGYNVTYTSHESDDGWQYDSEQNIIQISDFEVNFYNV